MAWQRGKYYVKSRRIGGRVVTEYAGAGLLGELAARRDAIERDQRAAQRYEAQQRRQQVVDLATPPAELAAYAAQARQIVAEVLTALGFHRHKRQWRYKRMSDDAQAVARGLAIWRKAKPTKDEIAELRTLVSAHPDLVKMGDVAALAESQFLAGYSVQPAMRVFVTARAADLRRQLGYAESSELERMLIYEVVLCWLDYNRIVAAHAQNTQEFKFRDMEAWERILSSKQRRYLRAVEALARVRRLLRLPAMQINVALDGGQQVNIAAD